MWLIIFVDWPSGPMALKLYLIFIDVVTSSSVLFLPSLVWEFSYIRCELDCTFVPYGFGVNCELNPFAPFLLLYVCF